MPQVGNYKMLNDWFANNMRAIQTVNEFSNIQVSSWACVVDIWWKKDFAPVRSNGQYPEGTASATNSVTY